MKSLIIFLLFIIACNNDRYNDKEEYDLPDNAIDPEINIFYETKKNFTKELNLYPLENCINFDSFELRIWARIEVRNYVDLYLIKKYNNQWIWSHYSFNESIRKIKMGEYSNFSDEDFCDVVVDSFKVVKTSPRSGWNNFFNKFDSLNIVNLPTQKEIPNWKYELSDGITYWVEFANSNKYKFISYNCPDYYANKYPECKKFNDFINIFKSEIGLPDYGYKWDCSP